MLSGWGAAAAFLALDRRVRVRTTGLSSAGFSAAASSTTSASSATSTTGAAAGFLRVRRVVVVVAIGAWKSTATPPVADSASGSGAGVSSTSTTGAAAAFFAGALRVEALRVVFFTTGFCSASEALSVAGSVTGSATTAFFAGVFFAAAFLGGAFFAAAAFLAGALRVVRVTTGGVSAVPTPSAIAPCEVVSLVSVWSESSMSCSSGTWCGAGLALPRIRGPGGRKASVAPTPSA